MAKKTSPKKKEEDRETLSTKEKIIEVALDVFGQKGLHGATMVEIAKRAGLTGGALYRYFDSKEALFRAVIDKHSNTIEALEMVRGLIQDLDPRTALKFLVQGILLVFLSQKEFFRLAASEAMKDPKLAEPVFEKMLNPARDFVCQCIDLWKEKGLVRADVDTTTAGIAFMGSMGYLAAESSFFENPHYADWDLNRIVDQITTVFLCGVLKGE